MPLRATLQALAALLVAAVQIDATPVTASNWPNLVPRDESACPARPAALTDDRFGDNHGDLAAGLGGPQHYEPVAQWLTVGGSFTRDILLDTGSPQLWVYDDQSVLGTLDTKITTTKFDSKMFAPDGASFIYNAAIKLLTLDLGAQKIGFVKASERPAEGSSMNGVIGLGFPKMSDGDPKDTSIITGVPFFTVAGGVQKDDPITLWNFDHIDQDKIDRTKLVSVPVTADTERGPRDLSSWTVTVPTIRFGGMVISDTSIDIRLESTLPGARLPLHIVTKVYDDFQARGGRLTQDGRGNGGFQYRIHKDDVAKWADIDFDFGNGKSWTQFAKSSLAYMGPPDDERYKDYILSPLQPIGSQGSSYLGGAFIRGNLVAFDSQGATSTSTGIEGCAAIHVAPLLKGDDLNLPS